MILEDDSVAEADVVVLPPSKVDEHSDCEAIDENDLLSGDVFPSDVAGLVEVQYDISKHSAEQPKRKRETCAEVKQSEPKTKRARRKHTKYADDEYGSLRSSRQTLKEVAENIPKADDQLDEDNIKGEAALPCITRKSNRVRKKNIKYTSDNDDGNIKPTVKKSDLIPRKARRHDDQSDGDDVEEAVKPSPHYKNVGGRKSEPTKVHWTKQKPNYSSQPVNNEKDEVSKLVYCLIAKTETELFHEFFDDELIDYICDQSNIYATQQNRHGFDLKPFQLMNFLGFLLFTGYHKLPREDMYWENAEDCNVSIVTNAISRQSFRDTKRNLHLSDNATVSSDDKLYKIRTYIKKLNEKFAKFGVFSHSLSIDEQMIPYFGRHSCKMFMKGKPVRFGFKAWCLCSSDGYLFQCLPYAGRDDNYDEELGLGASVVMSLLRIVPNPLHHAVYFDNFFTSHKLMIKLRQSGFHATGTVREPRLIASDLPDSKSLQKKERGSYDYRYDKNNDVLAVKWNDNSVVTLATNFQFVEPVLTAKRFSRADRRAVCVTQPNLIASYNANMGGVDLLDSFVAKYRTAVKVIIIYNNCFILWHTIWSILKFQAFYFYPLFHISFLLSFVHTY